MPAAATRIQCEDSTIPGAVKRMGAVIGVCDALFDKRAYPKEKEDKR